MAHQHIGVWLWYLVLLLRPHLFIYKPRPPGFPEEGAGDVGLPIWQLMSKYVPGRPHGLHLLTV